MPSHGVCSPRTVVGRLATILLTLRGGGSHSLTELAHLTGLPMSTVHRLAGELASWQLLRRDVDGRYRVGPNVQWLAGGAGVPGLDDRAPLALADLCEITGRRARLGVLRGWHVAYVEKRPGAGPPTSWSDAATLPAHATALGKVLLAFGPREAVASVQQMLAVHTETTVATPQRLLRELQIIRLTRHARSRGELVPGDCAIAAPVFGPGGTAIAALELQVQDLRGDLALCRAALDVAARGLSRELSLPESDGGDSPHLRLLPGAPDGMAAESARRLAPPPPKGCSLGS